MIKLSKIIKNSKRVGRGPASGKGKTSGRGMNGQRSRTGSSTVFQTGGQTSYFMRLPKAKGFKRQDKNYISVNASRLNDIFQDGDSVTSKEILEKLKIENKGGRPIKLYSIENLKTKLSFEEAIKIAKQKSEK